MCALYAIVACRVGEAGESSVLQAMLTLASMYRKGEACWRVSCFHLIYVSSWLFLTSSRSASFIRCFFLFPSMFADDVPGINFSVAGLSSRSSSGTSLLSAGEEQQQNKEELRMW